MSSPKFIDLSKTTFTITPDGKYCSFVAAIVNGKTFSTSSPKCYNITSDTYKDRVLCIGNAISEAYHFYIEGTGATSVTDETKQEVYNSIVQQFLSTIHAWDMCDTSKFVTAYNDEVNNTPVVNIQVIKVLKQHINNVSVALFANNCGTPSSSKSRPVYFWVLLTLGVLLIIGAILGGWYWYHKSKKSSNPMSSSSARRSSKRRT
jgi:hypothetical protein